MTLGEGGEVAGGGQIEAIGPSSDEVHVAVETGSKLGIDASRGTPPHLPRRGYSPRTMTFLFGSSPSLKLDAPPTSPIASCTILRS